MKALRVLAVILAMFIITACGSAGTSTTDQQGTNVTVSEFGNVEGTVKDALTNSPVSGVSIQIGEKVSSTSETGYYSIQGVNTGTRTVMAAKTGYDSYGGTVTVEKGTTVTHNIQMTGAVDTIPPTAPTKLIANAVSPNQIYLSWNASTDNVGVAGYKVHRDGIAIANATANTYSDTVYLPLIEYCYAVLGFDAAGNETLQSSQACATLSMSYTDNGDGTVSDNVTGLMWQKEDDGVKRTWADAGTYCDDLIFAGYTDWRLPSIDELKSIIKGGTIPAIDTAYFPNTNASYYWSSTTNAYGTGYAWYVYFGNGYVDSYGKTYYYYVRCVR